MKIKSITIAVIVAIVVLIIYQKVYIPKHTFQTKKFTQQSMKVQINGIGDVSAKNIYKIGSTYGGEVYNFDINEGEFVHKGDTIAMVDSVDLMDKIVEINATLHKIKSDTKALLADKQKAKTTYKYQQDIYKRNQNLYKKHAISQLELQKHKTDKTTAQLQVVSLYAKVKSLGFQKAQTVAALKGAQEKLSRYTIVAPVSGYITKKYISNHQIILPNQTLVDIVKPKDEWVATYIDTKVSNNIQIGNKATIVLRSSNTKFKGKVVNIKPINNNVTNEREVDVSFDQLKVPFFLDEQAVVDIDTKTLDNIIKLPNSAIVTYKQLRGVWTVENSHAKFYPIKVLATSDKFVATKDINSSQTVILPKTTNKSLTDGMSIYSKNKL
jgi:RND family efflux transporter MFP subunit